MPIKKNIKPVDEEKEEGEEEKVTQQLNPKQELFCRLYTRHGETYGCGVKAYAQAYGIEIDKADDYKVAQAAASRLLSNVIVYSKINSYLENDVLNDTVVDAQLAFLIAQHEDKTNKNKAISEYNKIKGRITNKIEHSGKVSLDSFMDKVTNG